MTAFGKILAFLNLVFAILTGGLIAMVFLTRTNWNDAYKRVQAAAVAADASYQQMLKEDAKIASDKDRLAQQAIRDRDAKVAELAAANTQLEQVRAQLSATIKTNQNDANNNQVISDEIVRRKNEVKQINEQLLTRDTRIRDLEKQLTTTRDEAVTNKLNYASLKERFENLLAQNEELSNQVRGFQGRGFAAPPSAAKPPPEQVRGTVKAVDGNLATISVGTDAGVNKDHVLKIFRLTPNPEYLGELTILSADPFQAVGRIKLSGRRLTIKPGDEVASRISP